MELINRTPAASQLLMGVDPANQERIFMLVTKLTCDAFGGSCTVATAGAVPVFMEDQQTPGGLLPRDDWFAAPDGFQVVMVGFARPPEPTRESCVSLRVGRTTRSMTVVGDRTASYGESQATEAQPFSALPLGWSRAYGGSADVEIDPSSSMRFAHSFNPGGRGYRPRVELDATAAMLGFPEGYPKLPPSRSMPNISKAGTEGNTEPYSWAALPLTALPHFNVFPTFQNDEEPDLFSMLSYRSHPDWRIAIPPPAAPVELTGAGSPRRFNLPNVRVLADYEVDERQGVLEARPELLALMPEEDKLYIVYRKRFRIPHDATSACIRVRLAEGWFEEGVTT